MSVHKKIQEGSGGIKQLLKRNASFARRSQRALAGDARNRAEMAGKNPQRVKQHKDEQGTRRILKKHGTKGSPNKVIKGQAKKDVSQMMGKINHTIRKSTKRKFSMSGPQGKLPESVHEKIQKASK